MSKDCKDTLHLVYLHSVFYHITGCKHNGKIKWPNFMQNSQILCSIYWFTGNWGCGPKTGDVRGVNLSLPCSYVHRLYTYIALDTLWLPSTCINARLYGLNECQYKERILIWVTIELTSHSTNDRSYQRRAFPNNSTDCTGDANQPNS